MKLLHRLRRFLRKRDNYGSEVKQNVNGSETIGTAVGGFLTLLSTIFFSIFVAIQLYTWVFHPHYEQLIQEDFMSCELTKDNAYEVPLHSFVPAFIIIDGGLENPDSHIFNDRAQWLYSFA